MRVLVACEFSGIVRDAFIRHGHDAMSCDLLPTESPGQHYQGDVFDLEHESFDLIIAHPPCTYFSLAGNRWLHGEGGPARLEKRAEALEFWTRLWTAWLGTPRAFENPRGTISTLFRKPDQTVFPWEFGDSPHKAICLWLDGLPPLVRTGPFVEDDRIMVNGQRWAKWHYESFNLPKAERAHLRSKFFPGIAEAMATQWGALDREAVAR